MSFETVSQQAIYTALNGVLTCPVYDEAPALPSGQPDNVFPYCVIGDDTAARFDTDSNTGSETTVTLHFWSRYPGQKEVKALMGEAYTALHRATLTATGYKFLDCLWEFSETPVDVDGKTRHGVQRYRLTIQKD